MNDTAILDHLKQWKGRWADLGKVAKRLKGVLRHGEPVRILVEEWQQTIQSGIDEIETGQKDIAQAGAPDEALLLAEALMATVQAQRYDSIVGAWMPSSTLLLKSHEAEATDFASRLREVGAVGIELRHKVHGVRSSLLGPADKTAQQAQKQTLAQVVGRFVDDDDKPFAHRKLVCMLPNGETTFIRTDADGYFRAPEGCRVYAEDDDQGFAFDAVPISKGSAR